MMLIGENLNVMNKKLSAAMKERRKEPIQQLVVLSQQAGVDYLDLNIGPARKDGPKLMEWLITTVREVSSLPLSLDTTNTEALRTGLEMEGSRALINSIQATAERVEQLFPLVQKYRCRFIALLLGKEGMPRDANERGALAAEMAAWVDQAGLPHEYVYFDPIVLPVAFQQDQVVAVMEFMRMLKEILPDFKSTCGLSNVSNGVPDSLRPLVNQTYLAMLMDCGLDSAIVDALDSELVALARGQRPEVNRTIKESLTGQLDAATLTEEKRRFTKTAEVLSGRSIYSHSW
ncbi:MAG TPA: dihydropteroate synthase, partial [bacterium]|nr:dihydropteroate synthase [bacterium]